MILQIVGAIIILLILFDLIKNKFSLVDMITEVTEEGIEKVSTMRFMSLICSFLFVWIAVYSVLNPDQFRFEILLIVGVLAFAPKAFQKFAENYDPNRNIKSG